MEHYFTSDPSVKSEERIIEYEFDNRKFVFISDNGVFSKNHVDDATSLLIKTIFDDAKRKSTRLRMWIWSNSELSWQKMKM